MHKHSEESWAWKTDQNIYPHCVLEKLISWLYTDIQEEQEKGRREKEGGKNLLRPDK